jgi:prepilin-type N-terminal cleavage/methylation domain-containing protein
MSGHGSHGFSMVEVLVSVAILATVSGATLFIVNSFIQIYTSTTLKAEMHSGVRSATALLAQEIGQAGLVPFTPTSLTAATTTTGSVIARVSSTGGMYLGQILQVDVGALQESVTATAVASATSFTGSFSKLHAIGAVVFASGAFPYGILSSSTATSLQMFGDINADGTLLYVRYDCDTTTNFRLSRSATQITGFGPIAPATSAAAVVLLDNLVANPGGTPCFQYGTTSVTTSGGTVYILYTALGLTISTQTSQKDPRTQQFVTETKSFLNMNPRNILAAASLASNSMTAFLQPTPAGLPLP